jgi:hypothetical protein
LIPGPSRGLVIRLPLSGTQRKSPMTQGARAMTEPPPRTEMPRCSGHEALLSREPRSTRVFCQHGMAEICDQSYRKPSKSAIRKARLFVRPFPYRDWVDHMLKRRGMTSWGEARICDLPMLDSLGGKIDRHSGRDDRSHRASLAPFSSSTPAKQGTSGSNVRDDPVNRRAGGCVGTSMRMLRGRGDRASTRQPPANQIPMPSLNRFVAILDGAFDAACAR